MGEQMKKNVGGDTHIRYKIITKSFRGETISRYSLKTNVNQQGKKKISAYRGKHTRFGNKNFLCLKLRK